MAKKASDTTGATAKRKKNAEQPIGDEVSAVTASVPVNEIVAAATVSAETAPPPVQRPTQNHSVLTVNLSAQLKSKIAYQASEEGISMNEYVSELLAEGVVLRAWEIVERKAQMRGGVSNPQQQNNNRNNNNSGGNPNNRNQNNGRNDRFNNRRGMSNSRYNNIMEDKASFLEYVRNQERQQGR